MLALCANAARTEHGEAVEPIAVSGNFLWAPDPGPMQVVTTVRKRGRRVSLIVSWPETVDVAESSRAEIL